MRTPRYSRACAVSLLAFWGGCGGTWAEPPAGPDSGVAPGSSPGEAQGSDVKGGGFLSTLKQAFKQDVDREVVRGHFDTGSPPNTHRFYCLVDPRTGKSETNAVAGEPVLRPDGMTGIKGAAVSPLSCADAEQKGILVTSGYTVKGSARSSSSPPAPAPTPVQRPAGSAAAHAEGATGTPRFLEVRGARLYIETFGHGPPIVFLHGGMSFFDNTFARQRDYFSAYRTVIGIDQRGHGHSPDGPWTLSYQLMADDTAAVIEQLGLGPVDIVGQSDGGDVALLLARDHPQLVRRMIISGANLRSGESAEEVQRRHAWSSEQLAAKLQEVTDSMPAHFRTDYGRVSPDGPGHWMSMLSKCYFMWLEPVVIEPADLKKISAPVLVMAGDHDFTSLEETAEIYRGLPHGQLIILPATGHGTLQNRPDLVNLAMREFLAQADSGAPPH